MRCWVVLIFLVPGVHAVAWEDPPGDHEMGARDTWAPPPPGWYPMADVLRMEMVEVDAWTVRLEVEVTSLEPGGEVGQRELVQYGVTAVGHPRNATWMIAEEPDGYWGWFVRDEEREIAGNQQVIPTRLTGGPADRDGNVLWATFGKGTFTAEGYGPSIFLDPGPRAGESVHLRPFVGQYAGPNFENYIDLRDEIGPAKTFVLQMEPPRRGDIELFVQHPYRGSNGAATTYLYDVSARNEGVTDETTRISVSAPADWVVRAPLEVTVPAGQTVVFPVAISVPFQHRHGSYQTATVQAVAGDGTESHADVHVYWHDPPQPGGHHSPVAVKVAYGHPFFDTGPAPAAGTVAPTARAHDGTGPVRETTSTWRINLAPSRSVGLDFDSQGAVTGATTFEVPQASDIRLVGRLMLSDGTAIAEQVIEDSWDGVHDVAWKMPILPGIDQFRPNEGGNLLFEFVLEHTVTDPSAGVVGSTAPRALIHLPDNWFQLPLSDYHEQIDLNEVGVARLSVHTPEPARLVNPNKIAVIPFEVGNHATAERRLEWTLDTEAEWISMEEPPKRLGPGQNRSFSVVAAPGDLPDGTVAQVLVIARDVETGTQSFGRVAVTVTTGQEIIDERMLAPKPTTVEERSPVPLGVIIAALWIVQRRIRRDRR